MKILHCYRTYFPDTQGGGEEAIRQIMLSTKSLGFENKLFALSKNPRPVVVERPEAMVLRSLSWASPASCDLGTWGAVREFRRLVRAADVVHYHFPWPFADVLNRFGNDIRKPTVMTYHSDIVRQRLLGALYRPSMIWMLRSMNYVVATSQAYVNSSPILRFVVMPDRLKAIPLGICEESYNRAISDSKSISIETDFGLGDRNYFLSLGVLRYYKGLHTLIEAANDVKIPIVIAGDGPLKRSLEELARSLPEGRVRFLGRVSDAEKVALIRGCRAFVLPSHLRSEAFGMVLIEAAMLGRPMITCEIGTGTSLANKHGETGIVVRPESPSGLASAMNRLIVDEEFAARCGLLARLRYEALFSGSILGAAYARIYENLLNNSRR